MQSLTPWLIGSIVACLLALATGSACLTGQRSAASTEQSSLGGEQPCREGLIVVEKQPDAPVRISNLKTDCRNPYMPGAGYQVETNGTRAIHRYEVRIIQSYDGVFDSYSTSSSETQEPGGSVFSKDQSSSDYMSWALKRGWFKDPEPKFTFTVWSVTFVDGTVWNRATG